MFSHTPLKNIEANKMKNTIEKRQEYEELPGAINDKIQLFMSCIGENYKTKAI